MKKIAILILTIIFISCNSTKNSAQVTTKKELQTEKYAGVYSYGNDIEKGAIGQITVFPETGNTILFYLELNLGPKSYNGGSLYGRLTLKNGIGIFASSSYTYQEIGCKWSVSIEDDTVTITTIDGNCGFGHNVTAGGTYTKKDNHKPEFFENLHSQKIYFSKTNPEEYYKE